jgi:coatomer subunit beta'
MEMGILVQTLKGHAGHISCVYHHPELPVVITGSHDGTLRLWNSTTYRYIEMLVFSIILLVGSRKTLQQYLCSGHVV